MCRPFGKTSFACFALFALLLSDAHADDFDSWGIHETPIEPVRIQPGLHGVERIGVTVGGNAISKLTRSDGTVREISAGGLYQVGLGALYQWQAIPVSASLTINYHYDSDYNGNDNASFQRTPVEALAYFNGPGNLRIGGGMRYVYAARASSTINGVTERFTFEDAHGSVVEIGYQVRQSGWASLRYVREIYRVATYSSTGNTPGLAGNAPYDGSHWGLFISYEY